MQDTGRQTNPTTAIKSHGYCSSFSCSPPLAGQFVVAVQWVSCLPGDSDLAFREDPHRDQQ